MRIKEYTYEEATDLLGRLNWPLDVVVDLGAGKRDSPISEQVKKIKCNHLISVEAFEPYLEVLLHAEHNALIHDVVKAHIIGSYYKIPSCDLVLMIDVIEHLDKLDALNLIDELKKKTKMIILFTPEGDTIGYSNHDMGNALQEHKSAWLPDELESLGFSVSVYEDFHTHVKDYPVSAMWAVWSHDK